MTTPKILAVDIETMAGKAYFWNMYDENFSIDQIIEPSRIICLAFKWIGKSEVTFYSEWGDGRPAMLTGIHQALSECDAVVTFNGDKFDLPRLNGEFIKVGLPPIPPLTSIDLRKTTKKLGLQSGKLDYVVQYYEIGKKIEHEGFPLWRKVDEGDEKARAKMMSYNKHDTKLTASLYLFLKPYMTNHPYIHDSGTCSGCGGDDFQHRGHRYTKTMKIERLLCNECGTWNSGRRTKKTS